MNILINCSVCKVGGGLQVAHSFIYQILNDAKHNYVIVLSSVLAKQIEQSKFKKNHKFFTYDKEANPINVIFSRDRFLDKIVKENKIDKVFTVFGPSYWKPKGEHIVGYAKPHYVYTDSPFFKVLSLINRLKLKLKGTFHMYDFKHNNQCLITENEDVSIRLRNILKGKKVLTVTNYYNQIFDEEQKWDTILQLPYFEGFTLLTISANYPHKNLQIIPKVIRCLNENRPDFKFRFVVTLPKDDLGVNLEDSIKNRIIYLDKVNINQCPPLYSKTDAVFLPTLLECFTATYPEAMRMSKPILTSDLNFAKGLCQGAAVYFNPLDEKDIANKIYELAQNEQLKEKLVAEGEKQLETYDTYESRAKKYLEIISHETNHPIL